MECLTFNYFYSLLSFSFRSTYAAERLIGQSNDFWMAYSLLNARVASFARERSEGANDATRDKYKLYARQNSFQYHYCQYTWPNRFFKCLVWLEKKLIFQFEIKSTTLRTTKSARTNSRQLWHWNGTLREPQVLIRQAKLFYTSAANQNQGVKAFAAHAFLVWRARRRVVLRAVCHMAAPIDNNRELACNVYEPWTATGNVLFPYSTCLHSTAFILSSLFSLVETINWKIWEKPLSWRTYAHFRSLPVDEKMLHAEVPYYCQSKAQRISHTFYV